MSFYMKQRQDKQEGELDTVIRQSSDKLSMHMVFHGLLTSSGHCGHILPFALVLQTELPGALCDFTPPVVSQTSNRPL